MRHMSMSFPASQHIPFVVSWLVILSIVEQAQLQLKTLGHASPLVFLVLLKSLFPAVVTVDLAQMEGWYVDNIFMCNAG